LKVKHKYDPLETIGIVVKRFKWLGNYKLIVKMPDGTFMKDYEHYFVEEN
jgi:hypothetical protein